MAADGKTPPTHPQGGAGTLCVHVVSLCADTKTMTCRPCLDTYIHTYKQTINQYKQIVIIHKSIETYSYTYTWLQMVRPPQPTHRGGGGNIMCTCSIFVCRHKNNDMSTLLGHAHTYIPTDRQTHRHTYINQYKHIVIPIHGCICVTYPPFGGGGVGGNQGGLDHIYIYIILVLNPWLWSFWILLSELISKCPRLNPWLISEADPSGQHWRIVAITGGK